MSNVWGMGINMAERKLRKISEKVFGGRDQVKKFFSGLGAEPFEKSYVDATSQFVGSYLGRFEELSEDERGFFIKSFGKKNGTLPYPSNL